jgi:hypothetical protein
MSLSIRERFRQDPRDLELVAVLLFCLVLAVSSIYSSLSKREVALTEGGPRQVDLTTIRKQISDGDLSAKKALFYRRVPK